MRTEVEYSEVFQSRSEASEKVLCSTSTKKIVMAGPGTGKSHLFIQLAKSYISDGKNKILVLSFINELVKDLTISMHGLAEVSTLHRYATKLLNQRTSMYMDLLDVIDEDLLILEGDKKELSKILHNLETTERDSIDFMRKRRGYYDRLDPSSVIFELLNYFRANPHKIPTYDLILVDEYQDFNLLEVELINELAKNNNILVAGDDDQSLYSFKQSIPENIRELYVSGDYEPFELPYCSRSTEVIIDAFHDAVSSAKANGYLSNRIEKNYLYFPTAEKDKLSDRYPKIAVRLGTQQQQCAYYIDKEIEKIFENEPDFDVLIICSMKNQINKIANLLRKKGYKNITGDNSISKNNKSLLDGLGALVEDIGSNLGWRLCAKALMNHEDFIESLKKTDDNITKFKDSLPALVVTEVTKLRTICKKLKEGTELTQIQKDIIFDKLEIDISKLGEQEARGQLFSTTTNKVHHDLEIKITTIQGSKGLSYDHVFLANFDDRYLMVEDTNDEKINMFLVALTRSRKKVTILSSQDVEPIMVGWIDPSRKVTIT